MTKLVIQIPCYNEEDTIRAALDDLPRSIEGIDTIALQIIDDGCEDRTVEIARERGDVTVLPLGMHRGLGRAFHAGLEKALRSNADIIVNTDADLQYRGDDIPRLIRPILEKKAHMVIGDRGVLEVPHFPFFKRLLQYCGTRAVNLVSGTKCLDVTSGFRALSREAAAGLHPSGASTYTIESVVQVHSLGLPVAHIPIKTRPPVRKSRLITSIPGYIARSTAVLLRTTARYAPLRFLAPPGLGLFGAGFLIGVRYLYFHLHSARSGHIQSLLLATLLMNLGFLVISIGIIADLLATNRRISEEVFRATRKIPVEDENGLPE